MAQIVQPNPNAIGGTTPTKVGAVIFDEPQYDPLTIQMKVMGELDEWVKDKEQQAAKEKEDAAKLIADIDFDTKGIYDQDTPYFTEGRQKLLDAQTELYKYQPNSPEFRQALAQAEREKRKYQTEVEASVMHKGLLFDTFKEFDPTKHDANVFKNWQAKMRTAPSIEERIKIAGEPALVPKQSTLEEKTLNLLNDAKKGGLIDYQDVETKYDKTPSGEDILIKKKELLPQQKSLDFAHSWLSTSDVKDDVYQRYSQLPPSEQQYYMNRAKDLSKQYSTKDNPKAYDPIGVFYSQTVLDKYNVMGEDQTQLGYSPERQAKAQFTWSAGEQEPKKIGEGLVKLISGIKQGKPAYIQPARVSYGGVEMDAVRAQGLNGYRLGTYTTTDKDNKPIVVPNEIKDVLRMPDGRIMVMTSKSYDAEYARTGGNENLMQIANLYIPYTSATQLYNSIVTGHYKGQGDEKIRTAGMDWVKENVPKAYRGATDFDDALIVSLTDKEKQDRDAIYGQRVVRTEDPNLKGEVPSTAIFKPSSTQQPQGKAKKEYTASSVTQAFVDKLGEGEIVIIDGVERVKSGGVLKKVKK